VDRAQRWPCEDRSVRRPVDGRSLV
jgi:hypothetical protein